MQLFLFTILSVDLEIILVIPNVNKKYEEKSKYFIFFLV